MVDSGFHKPGPLTFRREHNGKLAAAHGNKAKKVQVFILLNLPGGEAIERERPLTYGEGENREDLECLKMKFAAICAPQTNITMERYKSNTTVQGEGSF